MNGARRDPMMLEYSWFSSMRTTTRLGPPTRLRAGTEGNAAVGGCPGGVGARDDGGAGGVHAARPAMTSTATPSANRRRSAATNRAWPAPADGAAMHPPTAGGRTHRRTAAV